MKGLIDFRLKWKITLNRFLSRALVIAMTLLCGISVYNIYDPPRNPRDVGMINQKMEEIAERDTLIQKLTNKLACITKEVLPTGGFCLENSNVFQGGNFMWDGKVCAGLEKIFGYATVGDFGAGLGHYGSCFLRLAGNVIQTNNGDERKYLMDQYEKEMKNGDLFGKPQVIRSWEGFDSALNVDKISNGLIHELDLASEIHLDHKFDWVLSLEVGEHIPKKGEDIFIANIVRHACKGIVLSWAVEGQGGFNHINNHNNDYIIDKMQDQGLDYDDEATSELRMQAKQGYFRNTLMVYRFPEKRC